MGRKLVVGGLSWLLVGCGDDFSEAMTSGDETDGTTGLVTMTSDSFETFETVTVSDSVDDATFSEVGPDVTTFDTFDTSGSDTFETDSDPSFTTTFTTSDDSSEVSDTFESSESDSLSDSISLTDSDTLGTSTTDSTDSLSTTIEPTDSDPTDTVSDSDPTDTDPTDTDPTDTDSDTDTGGEGFPDAPAFGTNPLDFDLVGTWGLNWDPASGADSIIEVDDQGNFTWTETSADCTQVTVASGYLWVSEPNVTMHVEQWDRQLPWDTEPVLGETFEPPFRLTMAFTLQGSGGVAYLGLAAPSRITEFAPYLGESYIQTAAEGDFLAGNWYGEATLEAIPAGETSPVIVVRDGYVAELELEAAADDPQGIGARSITTHYFLPEDMQTQTVDYLGGNWGCLDGCPDPAGLTLINGGNLYTYGPYGGAQHLMPFVSGRAFRSDVVSDCI